MTPGTGVIRAPGPLQRQQMMVVRPPVVHTTSPQLFTHSNTYSRDYNQNQNVRDYSPREYHGMRENYNPNIPRFASNPHQQISHSYFSHQSEYTN